jgi:hypothetical protein
VWTGAAQIDAVLLTARGRRWPRPVSLARVAWFHLRSEHSGFVVVVADRTAMHATARTLATAPQRYEPRPGSTAALRVVRAALRRRTLTARIARPATPTGPPRGGGAERFAYHFVRSQRRPIDLRRRRPGRPGRPPPVARGRSFGARRSGEDRRGVEQGGDARHPRSRGGAGTGRRTTGHGKLRSRIGVTNGSLPGQLGEDRDEAAERHHDALGFRTRGTLGGTAVGKGRKATAIDSRLSRSSTGSTNRSRVNRRWWAIHTLPTVMKLVTYARYAGHSSSSARKRWLKSSGSSRISSTSSVIAIANTPSLNASTRPVSRSPPPGGDS